MKIALLIRQEMPILGLPSKVLCAGLGARSASVHVAASHANVKSIRSSSAHRASQRIPTGARSIAHTIYRCA